MTPYAGFFTEIVNTLEHICGEYIVTSDLHDKLLSQIETADALLTGKCLALDTLVARLKEAEAVVDAARLMNDGQTLGGMARQLDTVEAMADAYRSKYPSTPTTKDSTTRAEEVADISLNTGGESRAEFERDRLGQTGEDNAAKTRIEPRADICECGDPDCGPRQVADSVDIHSICHFCGQPVNKNCECTVLTVMISTRILKFSVRDAALKPDPATVRILVVMMDILTITRTTRFGSTQAMNPNARTATEQALSDGVRRMAVAGNGMAKLSTETIE